MSLLDHTFVINLDSRPDKWVQVSRQLAAIGVPEPMRVAATISKTAEVVGCSLSHIKCIELAKTMNLPHVFVCEDNFRCVDYARFKSSLGQFEAENMGHIDANQKQTENKIGRWDVLLLGGNNIPPYTTISGVDYCVCVENCQTSVGYIVLAHMYDTLIRNFKEGVIQLMRQPERQDEFAIDVYWRRLQADGTWYLLTPLTITTGFTCNVNGGACNQAQNQMSACSRNMLDLDKHWLLSPMYANREKKRAVAPK